MTMRSWRKLQEKKVMASHGTEDIAGRLPGDAYNLPGLHGPKPLPTPKAKLRAEAAAAWQEWSGRTQPHNATAGSS
jgi:hypothetical protein